MSDRTNYDDLKNHFTNNPTVELPSQKGAQGLKFNKKMFAMFWKGDLVLKLSRERIDELILNGIGKHYDPGTGSPMKDRVLISENHKSIWIELTQESLDFVRK